MKTIFERVRQKLSEGGNAVLCSIIASSGSTPRGKGAKMAVFADGTSVGTIGGGAVELKSTEYAMEVLKTGQSHTHAFRLAPNQVQDIGMICGGDVTVYFQYLTGESLPLVEAVLSLLRSGDCNSWLITAMRDDAFWSMGVYDEKHGLRFTDAISEQALQGMLGSSSVLKKGETSYYVEPLTISGTVYIFGGGHVGLALTPVLATAGFRVVVFDERPHAATKEAFPDAADVILGDYARISDYLTLQENDYVVIMTPGHQADFAVLQQTLPSPAGYVGCIGSRKKIAVTRQRLLEAGVSEADADRVHAPIGLPIGGETPAEVAVSIAAELIAYRAGHRGKFCWCEA